MPDRGLKRRISESTCDSSSCVFCIQRFPHPSDPVEQDISTEQGEDSSEDSAAASDFHIWLQKQNSDKSLLAGIDFRKMGLPTHQLDALQPSKQGCKLEAKQQHCESTIANSCHFLSSQQVLCDNPQKRPHDREVPWSWSDSWQDQTDVVPARFREVASFQQPVNSSNMRQHTADILCGVEFSPDAHFLATAGVAKQVSQFTYIPTAVSLFSGKHASHTQQNTYSCLQHKFPRKLNLQIFTTSAQHVCTDQLVQMCKLLALGSYHHCSTITMLCQDMLRERGFLLTNMSLCFAGQAIFLGRCII